VILLLASIAALLAGPVVLKISRTIPGVRRVMDWMVLIAVTLMVLAALVSEIGVIGTPGLLVAAAVGFLAPSSLEHLLHRAHRHRIETWTHVATLGLGLMGLVLHAAIDGAAIGGAVIGRSAAEPRGAMALLPVAVVLHRMPVGLTVWWLVRPRLGLGPAAAVLATMVLGTVIGFAVGAPLVRALSGEGVIRFQAFVAGTLLHVVLYRQHLTPHDEHSHAG
jgi:uncharacterized protein